MPEPAEPADPSVPSDEAALVRARRAQAGVAPEDALAPAAALALSGGGVRSATFCLGLLRALAQNGALHHFDYLSTVSGGGYVGSAYARLYQPGHTPAAVEAGLARDDSVLLWWLRSNGRYLTPAGLRDLLQAFASVFRGVLSTHFEVGMLLMLAAAGMVLPYVVLAWLARFGWVPAWMEYFRDHGVTFWWWAVMAPAALAGHHIFAYWFRRANHSVGSDIVDAVVAVLGLIIAFYWAPGVRALLHDTGRPWAAAVSALAWLLLFTPLTAAVHRRILSSRSLSEARLLHTQWLGGAMAGVGLCLAAGLVDWASAGLAERAEQAGASAGFTLPIGLLGVGALRWLLSKADRWRAWLKARLAGLGFARVVNLAGLAVLLIVVLLWATAFQWLWTSASPSRWLQGLTSWPAHPVQWLVLFAVPMLYVWLTRDNLEMVNLSSLHNFYRARLERAYVSTGNAMRFKHGVLGSRNEPGTDTSIPEMNVVQPIKGDDVELAQHQPHANGGPIHLVTCCINQTVDDRTGTYNADRKGVALTVSALGAETGTRMPDGKVVPGKLSTWAAVSGAAASSGMGSQTSPGSAALLFLTGLRLGYWQAALGDRKQEGATQSTRAKLIGAECFARFPGLRSAQWYLSDGGHFDNTGVYALLKRKLPLIVMADCGADPQYRFDDVENLVRKAFIDYAATVVFVEPPQTGDAQPAELRAAVGTPATVCSREGDPWLLLGQVRYADGSCGTLVVVKPRVVPGVLLDTASYAQRNAVFPQQTTGDQFFDEAQWEAYHQLGVHLGRLFTPANLRILQHWACGQLK